MVNMYSRSQVRGWGWKYSLDIVVTPPCPVDDAREENDEPRQAYTLKDETPPDPQQQPPEGAKAFGDGRQPQSVSW